MLVCVSQVASNSSPPACSARDRVRVRVRARARARARVRVRVRVGLRVRVRVRVRIGAEIRARTPLVPATLAPPLACLPPHLLTLTLTLTC